MESCRSPRADIIRAIATTSDSYHWGMERVMGWWNLVHGEDDDSADVEEEEAEADEEEDKDAERYAPDRGEADLEDAKGGDAVEEEEEEEETEEEEEETEKELERALIPTR